MIPNRRAFLLTMTGAGTILLGSGAAAQPPNRRILGGGGNGDVAAGVESPELARAVGAVQIGPIERADALAALFLTGDLGASLPIVTLDTARSQGDLLITERGQATVPELIVDNRLGQHVLLLAGEVLAGGKQNRVVIEDILLPPKSGERSLGVYCVEQGRWDASRSAFRSTGSLAGSSLRARVMAKSDQRSVWSTVQQYAASARASSPTNSYTAILESEAAEKRRTEVERQIDGRAPAGAVGVALFLGNRLLGLDVFSDASLFARQWPKILRAAVVDTLVTPTTTPADEADLRNTVAGLLKVAATTKGTRHTNAGVGTIFEFRAGNGLAAALVFEGRLVHLTIV